MSITPGKRTPYSPANYYFVAGIVFLLALTWIAYRPGLSGTFLFDDFINLPALGSYGPVDNNTTLIRYLTSGFADPTGRPLALLSFLIDARDWPADPSAFKRTNVVLHLLNGLLLCLLLVRLGRETPRSEKQMRVAAMLGAALWLLHPLWVSTTLYIVQREAMLPGTFVILGLLGYLHGRRVARERLMRGTIYAVASVVLCTLLGALSKANGLLLPFFICIVEYAFLQQFAPPPPALLKNSMRVFAYPVLFIIFAYLIYTGVSGMIQGAPAFRSWTYLQRLLTEPRVLLDYLWLLVVPRPYSRGLFNDDFIASTDLFHPWTTGPAILLIVGAVVVAARARRAFPLVSVAVLFYFAGHVMESTTVPLELYFEHRNYVPALLLFWPLAVWLSDFSSFAKAKAAIAGAALLLLSAELYAAASLWGEPGIQALVWAKQNPESARAQTYAASVERAAGNFSLAESRLRNALSAHPDEVQLAINLLGVRCQMGAITQNDISAAEYALRNGSTRGPLTFDWISNAIGIATDRTCSGLTTATLQTLIDAAWQNRQTMESPKYQQDLLDLRGQLALADGDVPGASAKFLEALKTAPKAEVALKQAAILGARGLPEKGLAQLDYYRQLQPAETPPANIRSMNNLHDWLLFRDGYWDGEIAHLRGILEEDVTTTAHTRTKQLDAEPVRP